MAYILERKVFGPSLRNHQDILIRNDLMPVLAKKLSQEPFDAVADDCVPDSPANRDAQSVLFPIVCLADDDKMGGVNFPSLLGQAQKFGSFFKTGLLRKPRSALRQHSTCFTCAPALGERQRSISSFPSPCAA